MASEHLTVEIPAVPPSLNVMGSRGSHWAYTRAKRNWQDLIGGYLMIGRLPRGLMFVEASATICFPVRRRRDPGNFAWLLEKALGDILVQGAWLPDDTARYFHWHGARLLDDPGPACTTLALRYERKAAA